MNYVVNLAPLYGGADCANLTGLQVVAGFVTWMNILKVFALLLGSGCFVFLLGRSFLRLVAVFKHVPMAFYEAIGYPLALALIVGGNYVTPQHSTWLIVPGSVLVAGMLSISATLRKIEPNLPRFFAILTVVWGVVAWWYQSEIVGFATVGAFMGLMGFSIFVTPLCYTIGFDSEDGLNRGTAAGLMMTVVMALKHVFAPHTVSFDVFDTGMLWLGPFVFALGLLITSTKWNTPERSYAVKQVVAVISYLALMGIGSVIGIDALRNVGTGFLILFLIEKPFEIPYRSATAFAATGLVMAVIVGYGVFWTQDHPDAVAAMFPHRMTVSFQ